MAVSGRYVLQFPTFTEFENAIQICDRDGVISRSQVFYWLDYGKLKESPTVAPTYIDQNIEPSGRNRVLEEVFVSAIPQNTYSVKLAATATLVINNPSAHSAVSSNTAYATVAVANGVVTITAVATGTAVVTIKDIDSNTIAVVNVTVS